MLKTEWKNLALAEVVCLQKRRARTHRSWTRKLISPREGHDERSIHTRSAPARPSCRVRGSTIGLADIGSGVDLCRRLGRARCPEVRLHFGPGYELRSLPPVLDWGDLPPQPHVLMKNSGASNR